MVYIIFYQTRKVNVICNLVTIYLLTFLYIIILRLQQAVLLNGCLPTDFSKWINLGNIHPNGFLNYLSLVTENKSDITVLKVAMLAIAEFLIITVMPFTCTV